MKKKLVVLLAVVMMFAFSASAYAATFSDVSDRPIVEQDAIKKAVALGIIEGYEDGTFGPDKTITRAEFAKIAVTAAGAKETATMLEANASSFKDVRANSWYTGWINAAESLGIFKGDTNGNFRPNDTISNQEAITVMLRLLGYNDNLTGSWPVNYVTKANQIGIMDDVSIVASAAAKRGDIVVMLGEALDTPIVTYDKDTNEFVYKQTTKSGSSYITLLDDSFEGTYLEVDDFAKVDQVRNVADKTLNWSVGQVVTTKTITSSTNNNTVIEEKIETYDGTLIIDENTAVSYNAESLFDLEHHQGKVYYVTEGGKKYARFIEVESYLQKVSDQPVADGSKVKVGTANYNAVKDVKDEISDVTKKSQKNSSYYMYFNDDDQVYRVVSDREFTDKAFYVKTITTASARLIGYPITKTVNMNDADTLIYDDGKFVSPSDLEVGDAIVEIREGELYVKVADQSGEFTRTEYGTLSNADITTYQHKATIDGKKYVFEETTTTTTDEKNQTILTRSPQFYEEDFEVAGITSEDVYNNNVKFLLNKDNTIAAIIVDETSTGTTLYGVVTDGGGNSGTWATNMSSITLFTQEGYTVTYDFAKNVAGTKPSEMTATAWMGQPVSYKLDSNGEIKSISKLSGILADGTNSKVEVKNNAYLVNKAYNQQLSLASNVVIFEVSNDDKEVDVSLVTRSALLSGGDFTVGNTGDVNMGIKDDAVFTQPIYAYAKYATNTNNAVKVLAYTNKGGVDYHYGVIKAWKFTDADHAGIVNGADDDYAITFVGDDKVYDLDPASYDTTKVVTSDHKAPAADNFVIYSLSGDKVTIVRAIRQDNKDLRDNRFAKAVTGYNDGLITVEYNYDEATEELSGGWMNVEKFYEDANGDTYSRYVNNIYRAMTDTNTMVFVLDSNSGDYREGALDDISRNSYVYVPVIDADGYAEVVLVDEYPRATTPSSQDPTFILEAKFASGFGLDGETAGKLTYGISKSVATVTFTEPTDAYRRAVGYTFNGTEWVAGNNGLKSTTATWTVVGRRNGYTDIVPTISGQGTTAITFPVVDNYTYEVTLTIDIK